jgi:hypothetical protein
VRPQRPLKGSGNSQDLGNKPEEKPLQLKDFLQNTAADELFEDLKAVYEEEQMRKLGTLISTHLTKASGVRRPLTQPQASA